MAGAVAIIARGGRHQQGKSRSGGRSGSVCSELAGNGKLGKQRSASGL